MVHTVSKKYIYIKSLTYRNLAVAVSIEVNDNAQNILWEGESFFLPSFLSFKNTLTVRIVICLLRAAELLDM